jgi:hypothetical protein
LRQNERVSLWRSRIEKLTFYKIATYYRIDPKKSLVVASIGIYTDLSQFLKEELVDKHTYHRSVHNFAL